MCSLVTEYHALSVGTALSHIFPGSVVFILLWHEAALKSDGKASHKEHIFFAS
jgi:hypothetical protein